MSDLSDLPDELQDGPGKAAPAPLSEKELAAQYAYLVGLGRLIGDKRDAVVKARKQSGIEDVWTACEEAYAGIDEMNRADVPGAGHGWRKPTSPTGPLTRDAAKAAESRSSVYVRLTTRYVDMASAKVKEKALPVGGMPFSLEPSPEPEMIKAQPVPNPASAQPAQPDPVAQAAAQTAQDAGQVQSGADKASKRIWDWMEESRFSRHIRRVIDDGARIGTGVLKGPFPKGTSDRALSRDGDKVELEIVQRTYPGVEWVDPWNFFPAGNCGEDIHDGDHCFERSYLSEGKLRALKDLREPLGEAIYLPDAIDTVIEEGPEKCNLDERGQRKEAPAEKKGMYLLWQYTGEMTRADMIALKALGAEELPDDVIYCNAIVTLVNDTVIRAQFNPLEKSGNLPYRVFCWSRRAGSWAGVGVGEQVAVPQRMINAGTRAWMNNAGVSSGVQLVKDYRLQPADGSLVIGGGIKIWEPTAEAMGVDVRTLMAAIDIPNLGPQLKAIVDYAFQLAEELSNIPLVSQGRDGPTTPQTFGQAELQNTNGNTLLRAVADSLDSDVFEPLIDDYYELVLLDPEIPIEEKGDFQIIAKGCSAMVEKAIQEQTLLMMGQMTLNPAFGMSPQRWMEMFARAKRIDPQELAMTPEEKQAHSQPMETPQEKVAKINAATRLHVADMDGTVKREVAANAHDRGLAYEQALAEQDRIRLDQAGKELDLKWQIALLDYAKAMKITIEQAKKDLAQTSMKIDAQREISRDNLAVSLHTHHNPAPAPDALTPAIEPAGRAPNGQAFSQ